MPMQPGEEIESLVSELEQVVSEGKTPFGGGGGRPGARPGGRPGGFGGGGRRF